MWIISFLFLLVSVQPSVATGTDTNQLIVKTLQKETQYFCERNLSKWKDQWSQKPFVAKKYIRGLKAEIYTGWKSIEQYTIEHIKQYPNPIPIPDTNFEYDIYVLGETAWVLYHKMEEGHKVLETRFMTKEGEKWKIARMETIYTEGQK